MSAASPKIQDAAQEPSMEEILASIRRIIADDQAEKPAVEPSLPEPENDDVLDLAEVARPVAKAPPAPPPPEPDPFDAADFGLDEDEIAFAAPEPAPPPKPVPGRLEAEIEQQAVERLVSKQTDESVGQAFHLLAHTVLANNARTLEDLVADMLRPMLKAWLDDNLPGMVERLVRAEIERVARGR